MIVRAYNDNVSMVIVTTIGQLLLLLLLLMDLIEGQ